MVWRCYFSRRCKKLIRVAIGTEAEQGCNVANSIHSLIGRNQHQTNVVSDGGRDQGLTDIGKLAGFAPACWAVRDRVRIQVAAVRALDSMRRILGSHDDALDLTQFRGSKHSPKASDTTSLASRPLECFADQSLMVLLQSVAHNTPRLGQCHFLSHAADLSRKVPE